MITTLICLLNLGCWLVVSIAMKVPYFGALDGTRIYFGLVLLNNSIEHCLLLTAIYVYWVRPAAGKVCCLCSSAMVGLLVGRTTSTVG
jgi:hypothetical protein